MTTSLLTPCLICGKRTLQRLCNSCRNRSAARGMDRIGEEKERFKRPRRGPGRPRRRGRSETLEDWGSGLE